MKPHFNNLGWKIPIRRVITGLWQMADQERDGRPIDLDGAAEALLAHARAGFDTFDMARSLWQHRDRSWHGPQGHAHCW